MIEIIPYILVILSWPHDETGKVSEVDKRVVARTQLTMTVEECKSLGEEYLASRKIYADELPKAEHSYVCIEAPQSEDYRALFERERQETN